MEGLCSTAACVCVYFPMYLTKSCRLNFSVHWATMCPCILVRSKLCKRIKKNPQLWASVRRDAENTARPRIKNQRKVWKKKRKEKTQTCRRSTSEMAAPSFTFDPDVVDAQLSTRWLRVLFLLVVLGWSAASCVCWPFMTFYRTTIVNIHVLWYQFWTIVNLSNLKQTSRQDVL